MNSVLRLRQHHKSQDFTWLQIVLTPNVLIRRQEKGLQRNDAPGSLRTDQFCLGIEGNQSCRHRGRVNDGAPVLAKDRVILVLADKREARLATLAQAVVMQRAEIPATRPLQQIAADCRYLADLRAGRLPRGLGQGTVAGTDQCMSGELRERNHRPDAQGPVRLFDDLPKFRYIAQSVEEADRKTTRLKSSHL